MASESWGPYSATPGTAIHVTLAKDVYVVRVENDTPYDLLILFGGSVTPTALTSLQGQYNERVPSGHHLPVFVQTRGVSARERMVNAIGQFDGNIWIMPVNRPGLLNPGSISALNQFSLTAFYAQDSYPEALVAPQRIDLASQPRIVAIPLAPSQLYTGRWDQTATPTLSLTNGEMQFITRGDGSLGVTVYLFSLHFTGAPNVTGTCEIKFVVQPVDNTDTPVGPFVELWRGYVTSPGERQYQPNYPTGMSFTNSPINVAGVNIELIYNSGTGITPQLLDYVIQMDIDFYNPGVVPGHGGGIAGQAIHGSYTTFQAVY